MVESNGCEVVKALSIMDRMAGGSEDCRRRGYDFQSVFRASMEGKISIVS